MTHINLQSLYRQMLRTRLTEEKLAEGVSNGEICTPCHLYTGEEAIAVGVCANLKKTDNVFGNHRSHGHYLAKGGDLKKLFAEIYGKETGCCHGRGGSMHLIAPEQGFLGSTPIVAGTISLALGSALASKIRGDKKVTVSFFGDGATSEGVLYESLNFAALKKLPLIFVCENNFYATHLRLREFRLKDNIWEIAKPFGIPNMQIDGNDVLKIFDASKKAVNLCRQNKGPVFLECRTYRLMGHVGPDDNIQGTRTDIRPKKEIEQWKKKDPIKKLEKIMLTRHFAVKKELTIIKKEVAKEIEDAYLFAQNSPYPPKKELTKYVLELKTKSEKLKTKT